MIKNVNIAPKKRNPFIKTKSYNNKTLKTQIRIDKFTKFKIKSTAKTVQTLNRRKQNINY